MELIVFIILAVVGLVFGSLNEKKHYRNLLANERRYRHILVFNEKRPPLAVAGQPFHLVQGAVVISSDYFKTMAAGLRSLFGGNLTSYESLLDRARREALVRLKKQAHERGAHMVVGVLFETSTLNQNTGKKQIMCCEVLAYGTAFVMPSKPKEPTERQTA